MENGMFFNPLNPLASMQAERVVIHCLETNTTGQQMRKMAHGLLNTSVAKSYGAYQELENKQMLRDMLHNPDDFLEHIRRYSNSLTTSMTYG